MLNSVIKNNNNYQFYYFFFNIDYIMKKLLNLYIKMDNIYLIISLLLNIFLI